MMLVSSRPDVCNTSLSVFAKWASQLCLRLSVRCTDGAIFPSSPIEDSSVLRSRHAARTSISFVYSELPGRVSIVNFVLAGNAEWFGASPFFSLLGEKRSDNKSAVCLLTSGKRPK